MDLNVPTPPIPRPRPRLRDHGIRIGRLEPGQLNAITDVPGVRVGHATVISGEGPLVPHVTREHVFASLDAAAGGPIAEGNVGGGTGMTLYGFKGGIGTSSRIVTIDDRSYAVGVLVQGNYGRRHDPLIDGVPLCQALLDWEPEPDRGNDGSIIVVIATDAPLSERRLGRLCRRDMLGLGRIGAIARHTSGDLLIAFSNAQENRVARTDRPARRTFLYLDDEHLDDLFAATIEATAESVLNAMAAAEPMVGRDGHVAYALPMDDG